MAENVANQIARQLWAMSTRKRDANLVESMRNEKYQRSWTDEQYPLKDKGRFKAVPEEQKAAWAALSNKGER